MGAKKEGAEPSLPRVPRQGAHSTALGRRPLAGARSDVLPCGYKGKCPGWRFLEDSIERSRVVRMSARSNR